MACCRFGGHPDQLNQATAASHSKLIGPCAARDKDEGAAPSWNGDEASGRENDAEQRNGGGENLKRPGFSVSGLI